MGRGFTGDSVKQSCFFGYEALHEIVREVQSAVVSPCSQKRRKTHTVVGKRHHGVKPAERGCRIAVAKSVYEIDFVGILGTRS